MPTLLIPSSFQFEACQHQDKGACHVTVTKYFSKSAHETGNCFTLPGSRLLFIGCQRSGLFEHQKTAMASLDFQGDGVVSVDTNDDISRGRLCLRSK